MKLFLVPAFFAMSSGEDISSGWFNLLAHGLKGLHKAHTFMTGMNNYGCTGVGFFDETAKNMGHPLDAVDAALNNRKKCISCAAQKYGVEYKFS